VNDHDDIMTALETAIQWKRSRRCTDFTLDRLPESLRWVLGDEYRKYWEGVFVCQNGRWRLDRAWQSTMEVNRANRADLWRDKAKWLEARKKQS
jgi:hypothetical protein